MKTCKGCRWAEWKRTAAGKLHPDGYGKCAFPLKIPKLPTAFYWSGYGAGLGTPPISGGVIERHRELRDQCPCYAPEQP